MAVMPPIYVTHSLPWFLLLGPGDGPVYYPGRTRCPECGVALLVDIQEWESETGIPTEGGVEVDCAAVDWDDAFTNHRYWQSDWEHARDTVERWARRHLRKVWGPEPDGFQDYYGPGELIEDVDDPSLECPVCGAEPEWEDCWNCEDGYVDAYEDDPVNNNPGDIDPCAVCLGRGGWHTCTRLPHSDEQVAAYRERTGGDHDPHSC